MEALQTYGLEIGILLGTLFLIILLFVSMDRVRRSRGRRATGSAGTLPRVRGLNLSGQDQLLLDRLGWLLRSPGRAGQLLANRSVFLKAARRALDEGILSEEELIRLGRRAGFKLDRIRPSRTSTMRLPSGTEVSVADNRQNSGSGVLFQNHPDALKVRLRRGHTAFAPGTELDVVCATGRGLYRFNTTVSRSSGRVHLLAHTSNVDMVQRRRHRRHVLAVPGEIAMARGQGAIRTRTVDLSIGGAAIRNPDRKLVANIDLALRLHTERGTVTVPASVVRLSRGGKLAHLRFHEFDESTRHRLFRVLTSANGRG